MDAEELVTVWDGARERAWIQSQQIHVRPMSPDVRPEPISRPRLHAGRNGLMAGRIRAVMADGKWWTVPDLSTATGYQPLRVASALSNFAVQGRVVAEHPRHKVGGASPIRQRYRLVR